MKKMLIAVMILAGIGLSSGGYAKTFPIGALFPMTGPQAYYGRVMSRGCSLAIDHINAAGGVEGYQFKLIITDYKNVDTHLAVSGAEKMIIMDKIPFILVSFSAVILATQPICENAKVLMINAGAYSPKLADKPFLYSTKIIQTQMVPPMLNYFWNMNIRKIGVLYIANPAGEVPAKDYVQPLWTKMGGSVVAMEPHEPGLTDFTPYLSKIKAGNADAIYDISTGQDQAYVIRNAREMGMNIPITVPDWGTDYYNITGKTSENVYIPGDHFDPESADPIVSRFVKEFESQWKEPPDIFAANYYEAIYYLLPELIRRTIKNGKNPLNGAELEKAIWTDSTFKTLYGDKITLNRDGTCKKPIAIFKIVDGKKMLVKKVE